ncbi:hypothetical protein FOZ63_031951, partial [Perkinsus olseni]
KFSTTTKETANHVHAAVRAHRRAKLTRLRDIDEDPALEPAGGLHVKVGAGEGFPENLRAAAFSLWATEIVTLVFVVVVNDLVVLVVEDWVVVVVVDLVVVVDDL